MHRGAHRKGPCALSYDSSRGYPIVHEPASRRQTSYLSTGASVARPPISHPAPPYTGARIILKSQFGYEITNRINIFQDRFLVGHTNETVLLGDLESCKLSEVPWAGGGHEKFYFDNEKVAMIFNAGELSLVEYAARAILAQFGAILAQFCAIL